MHVTSSTALHCDGCQASVEGTVSFCPYAGGCQACADKGCFTFKPKVQGDLYLDGVSVESGNYYGKWPSYRAVSFRKDLARREVRCCDAPALIQTCDRNLSHASCRPLPIRIT